MKIPRNAFSKKQLEALSLSSINFDFDKDYSEEAICDIEEKIGNIVCDHAYSNDLEFYEKIIDIFTQLQE